MQKPRKQLLLALGAIVVGTLGFLAFLAVTGDADDGHSLGMIDWVVAGMLIGPGFGLLIKSRQG